MQRRIAFYMPRVNHLRAVAPVIDYLVRHCAETFRVTVLYPGWKTSKLALQPKAEDFSSLFGNRVAVERLEDPFALLRLIRTGSIDALVNLLTQVTDVDPRLLATLRAESRKVGTRWIALPYVFAQSEFVLKEPEAARDMWDLICVEGSCSVEYIESHLNGASRALTQALMKRVVIIGYPELDGVGLLADAQTIRHKYSLPADRPLIFVATAPTFYPLVNRSVTMYGLERRFRAEWCLSLRDLAGYLASLHHPVLTPYRRYLSALRRFADANNACLVAKTRAKHRDPSYLTDYVDYVFGDQSFFPFTTLELLRVSKLYVGFYSSAVIEALALGVYPITMLFMPIERVEPSPVRRAWFEFFHRGEGSLWNTRGVSELVDGTNRSGAAWLKRFVRSSLEQYAVDGSRQAQLLDKFISYRGRSCERFVEVLASCWS
ncbi:MAG: hypothetical protein HYY59_07665 [Candidatus Omnitrophica bacterium]|nr:hypothetical protein [Candidatus Omnitrophota bacterium]